GRDVLRAHGRVALDVRIGGSKHAGASPGFHGGAEGYERHDRGLRYHDMRSLILFALLATALTAQQPAQPAMMPYVAIHEPVFIAASQATFALDDDLVIGVVKGTTARAYPALDLTQHGSVEDRMPDGPIEVTWCGTCGTGAVFRAELNGRPLHFEY